MPRLETSLTNTISEIQMLPGGKYVRFLSQRAVLASNKLTKKMRERGGQRRPHASLSLLILSHGFRTKLFRSTETSRPLIFSPGHCPLPPSIHAALRWRWSLGNSGHSGTDGLVFCLPALLAPNFFFFFYSVR